MTVRRIRIIGASGSGKIYLAKVISGKSDFVCLDLDNIVFKCLINGKPQYFTEQYRIESLQCFLDQEEWVIEGSYYQRWTISTFEEADLILVLNITGYIRNWRVITRSIQNRYSLKTIVRHLMYSYMWEKEDKTKALKALKPYRHKVRVVNSFEEAFRLIN